MLLYIVNISAEVAICGEKHLLALKSWILSSSSSFKRTGIRLFFLSWETSSITFFAFLINNRPAPDALIYSKCPRRGNELHGNAPPYSQKPDSLVLLPLFLTDRGPVFFYSRSGAAGALKIDYCILIIDY